IGHLTLASQGSLEATPFIGDLLADGATPTLSPAQEPQLTKLFATGPVLAPATGPPPLPATSETYGLGPQLPRVFERLDFGAQAPAISRRGERLPVKRLLWAGAIATVLVGVVAVSALLWAAKDRFANRPPQPTVAQQDQKEKEDKHEPP